MPQPLRKRFTRSTGGAAGPERFTLRLSPVAAALISMVLVAAVGWAFFMGFMVGRGKTPQSVGEMAGLIARKDTDQKATPPAGTETGAAPEGAAAAEAAPIQDKEGRPANMTAAEQPRPSGQTPGDPAQPARFSPFQRPQGSGLDAWAGAAPTGQPGAEAGANPAAAREGATAPQRQERTERKADAPQFDYEYQVAVFRGKSEAERLRARLTAKGIRCQVKPSSKVFLVMARLRGTEQDAAALRKTLDGMRLGQPLQTARRPVRQKGAAAATRARAPKNTGEAKNRQH